MVGLSVGVFRRDLVECDVRPVTCLDKELMVLFIDVSAASIKVSGFPRIR